MFLRSVLLYEFYRFFNLALLMATQLVPRPLSLAVTLVPRPLSLVPLPFPNSIQRLHQSQRFIQSPNPAFL